MSESVTPTPEKQTAEEKTAATAGAAVAETKAAPEAPAEPIEKPFCPDILISCTSRFTRKAWNILLGMLNGDQTQLTTVPLRAKLTAKSPEGAAELHQTLMKEKGVTEIKLVGKEIAVVATFADIQSVIKNPQTAMLDATLAQ
jgi:hypothetical protein